MNLIPLAIFVIILLTISFSLTVPVSLNRKSWLGFRIWAGILTGFNLFSICRLFAYIILSLEAK